MKRILKFIVLSLILTLAVPAILPVTGVVAKAAEVKLNVSNISVRVNQTYQLKITGSTKTASWSSSNKTIVTVDSTGKIKGIKKGKATITATISGQKYSATVSVVVALVYDDYGYEEYVLDTGDTYCMIYTEFIRENQKKEGYFKSFDSSDGTKEGIRRTARGIVIGDKVSDVKKAYGYAKLIPYSSTDLIHKYVAVNYPDVDVKSRWKKYMEYTYNQKDKDMTGEFRLRFYFDKNNKVTEIMFIKDYDEF